MSYVACLLAAVEFERAAPLPSFDLEIYSESHVYEFVCPPGTFVRAWDGRADADGLYALAVTCSDGTLVGDVGSWGNGEAFAALTQTDGYSSITAFTDSAGSVVGILFTDRFDDSSPRYGASGTPQLSSCREAQHVVGLVIRETTGSGNIGTFGLLCGEVKGKPLSSGQAVDMLCLALLAAVVGVFHQGLIDTTWQHTQFLLQDVMHELISFPS